MPKRNTLAPTAAGGLGWDLATVVAAQRVLAMHSPATALAVNMHQIWNGVASVLARQGDDLLSFVHRESAAGEVFAFGISEAGNDAVLFDSDTVAEPLGDGSYRFTGTKIFTTLSPAWTRLGVFGKTPDGEQLVFGFLDRTAPGWSADASSWDMLGTNLSEKLEAGAWATDTDRLILMDRYRRNVDFQVQARHEADRHAGEPRLRLDTTPDWVFDADRRGPVDAALSELAQAFDGVLEQSALLGGLFFVAALPGFLLLTYAAGWRLAGWVEVMLDLGFENDTVRLAASAFSPPDA